MSPPKLPAGMPIRASGEVLFGDLAPIYDRIYGPKSYRAESTELHTIALRAGRRGAASLLDVACGTGRHLEQFARWYPDRAGVDASPPMLRIARQRLGPTVPLTLGDMRNFDLGRRFDVITCLFSAIGYLTARRDRDQALANFARHLAPGGVVLVEGWVLPDRWRGTTSRLQLVDAPDLKVARLTTPLRRGTMSILDMHYLVARPGDPVRHYAEKHYNRLVAAEKTLRSFRRAGLRAWVLQSGRWRDRGLFVGVAGEPTGPATPSGPGPARIRPAP